MLSETLTLGNGGMGYGHVKLLGVLWGMVGNGSMGRGSMVRGVLGYEEPAHYGGVRGSMVRGMLGYEGPIWV